MKLDEDNGNTHWMDAVRSEMKDMFDLKYFDIMDIGYKCDNVNQKTTLTMLFTVK